jgi:hypothetical protein
MSLKDALNAAAPKKRGPACSVCRLLQDLPSEDSQALQDALDAGLAESALTRAIRSEGHYVGKGAIGRHRRGDCAGL